MDDQRLVFRRGFQLIVGLDLPAVAVILHRTLRFTHVGIADGAAHVIQRDALVKQRLRVQPHAHRGQGATADVHIPHAVDLGDGLRQLGGGEVVQLPLGVGVRGERQDHNGRIGRVSFAVVRPTRHPAREQALRGIDRCLHVARRAVDVAVKVKLQNDARAAEGAARRHLVDPGNTPERALQRRGHRRGHGFRRSTGQRGADHDHREIHLRQRGHRQQPEAQHAAQGDGERD